MLPRTSPALWGERAGNPPMPGLLPPVAALGSNVLSGVIEFYQEPDGKGRRHYYDRDYLSMAWRLAEMMGKAPPERAKRGSINYYGPSGTIDHVPYAAAPSTTGIPPITSSTTF